MIENKCQNVNIPNVHNLQDDNSQSGVFGATSIQESKINYGLIYIIQKHGILGLMVVFSIVQVSSYILDWKSAWTFALPSIPEVMPRTNFKRK